ncbi:MAG TPA: hypothetical protein VGD66_03050 [Allosphingosinicella sp.]
MAGEGAEAAGAAHARTLVAGLSRDLARIAAALGEAARESAGRRRRRTLDQGPTAEQVAALIAANRGRSAAFGLDLADPGWTLLLTLFHTRLEARPARPEDLPAATGLAPAALLRWLDRLCENGHARRFPDPGTPGDTLVELTDPGTARMRDYFAAADRWE